MGTPAATAPARYNQEDSRCHNLCAKRPILLFCLTTWVVSYLYSEKKNLLEVFNSIYIFNRCGLGGM